MRSGVPRSPHRRCDPPFERDGLVTSCGMIHGRSLLLAVVLTSAPAYGCGEDDSSLHLDIVTNAAVPAVPLANAAQLGGPWASGSGVYIGDGYVLTNAHVCAAEDSALAYNDPGMAGPRYREGAPLDGFRCGDELTLTRKGQVCTPLAQSGSARFPSDPPFSSEDVRLDLSVGGTVVFMQRALDLCIVKLADSSPTQVPTDVRPVQISRTPVHVGQEIVVAGYPLGQSALVSERCKVTGEPELVRDPDQVNPSDSIVMSFAMDCQSTQHGSSGSPVFDAATGHLLGLLWTGECKELGKCRGTSYATAASSWLLLQGERPVEQHSRLDELFAKYGVE
jgi:hypothetical protein